MEGIIILILLALVVIFIVMPIVAVTKAGGAVREAKHAREQVRELEAQIAQQEEAKKNLSEQRDLAKLATLVKTRDEAATEELKKKINEYIREIDQCLKLIGD